MALFVVQHKHDPATCPARDKTMGPQLLQIIAGAPQAGVTIQAEAIVDGGHELNMIVEAADAQSVRRFMAPFAQMGTVSVRGASLCERVVERGSC